MARHRTMVNISWSIQRARQGEQAYWATVALTALLGQLGTPGGGLGFGYACTNLAGAVRKAFSGPPLTRRRECGGQRYPGGAAVRYAAAPGRNL
ncbi:biotin sulfoxide reductase [Klebsiella pneumoniae]|uniref:Biotin sulfoxide reductase n=1 Tax=Klebsiella pneumoniae TaxID=573 RepID=A0A2X3E3M0_KLEPN|nr:biotin sulfoxide reductase [Klebsiella pneumoniae]